MLMSGIKSPYPLVGNHRYIGTSIREIVFFGQKSICATKRDLRSTWQSQKSFFLLLKSRTIIHILLRKDCGGPLLVAGDIYQCINRVSIEPDFWVSRIIY